MRKITLTITAILSLIFSLLIGIPNFIPARSVPGGGCYEKCRNLTNEIALFNDDKFSSGKVEEQFHVFTETPENIAFLKNELQVQYDLHYSPECNLGTVGDLSEEGFIVCAHHGSYLKKQEKNDLEAVFFSRGKEIFKMKGLPDSNEFAQTSKNELRFTAALILILAFIITFIILTALIKLLAPRLLADM